MWAFATGPIGSPLIASLLVSTGSLIIGVPGALLGFCVGFLLVFWAWRNQM